MAAVGAGAPVSLGALRELGERGTGVGRRAAAVAAERRGRRRRGAPHRQEQRREENDQANDNGDAEARAHLRVLKVHGLVEADALELLLERRRRGVDRFHLVRHRAAGELSRPACGQTNRVRPRELCGGAGRGETPVRGVEGAARRDPRDEERRGETESVRGARVRRPTGGRFGAARRLCRGGTLHICGRRVFGRGYRGCVAHLDDVLALVRSAWPPAVIQAAHQPTLRL